MLKNGHHEWYTEVYTVGFTGKYIFIFEMCVRQISQNLPPLSIAQYSDSWLSPSHTAAGPSALLHFNTLALPPYIPPLSTTQPPQNTCMCAHLVDTGTSFNPPVIFVSVTAKIFLDQCDPMRFWLSKNGQKPQNPDLFVYCTCYYYNFNQYLVQWCWPPLTDHGSIRIIHLFFTKNTQSNKCFCSWKKPR